MHRRRFFAISRSEDTKHPCHYINAPKRTQPIIHQCVLYYTLTTGTAFYKVKVRILIKEQGKKRWTIVLTFSCAVLGRFNFCISLVALSLYEVQTKAGLLGNRTRHAIFSPLLDAFFLDSHGHFRRRGRRWRWIKLLFWIGRIPVHS